MNNLNYYKVKALRIEVISINCILFYASLFAANRNLLIIAESTFDRLSDHLPAQYLEFNWWIRKMKRVTLYLFIWLLNCGLVNNSSQKETTTTKYICEHFIILSNSEVDIRKKKELEEDYLRCKIVREIERENFPRLFQNIYLWEKDNPFLL